MKHHSQFKLVVEYDVADGERPMDNADAHLLGIVAAVREHFTEISRLCDTPVSIVAHSSRGSILPGPAPYPSAHLEPTR